MSKTIDPNREQYRLLVQAAREHRGLSTPLRVLADHLTDDQDYEGPFVDFIRGMCDYHERVPGKNALGIDGWQRFDMARMAEQHRLQHLLVASWGRFPFISDEIDGVGGRHDRHRLLPAVQLRQWQWVQGFPAEVVCPWDYWVKHWRTLTALGPVGTVFLTTWPDAYQEDRVLSKCLEIGVVEPELGRIIRERGEAIPTTTVIPHKLLAMETRSRGDLYRAHVELILHRFWPCGDLVESVVIEPEMARIIG